MRADYDSRQAGQTPPQGVRSLLRFLHHHVCGAFPVAIDRAARWGDGYKFVALRSGYAHWRRSRRWTMVPQITVCSPWQTSFVPATRRRRTAPRLSRANGLLALARLGRGASARSLGARGVRIAGLLKAALERARAWHKSAKLRPVTGDYQFTFWALHTKAASSALKRQRTNGEWPMPW